MLFVFVVCCLLFVVCCLLPTENESHGDQRDLLQKALQDVVANMREDPTLPGSDADQEKADADMLREDAAVEMPTKHWFVCLFVSLLFGWLVGWFVCLYKVVQVGTSC